MLLPQQLKKKQNKTKQETNMSLHNKNIQHNRKHSYND